MTKKPNSDPGIHEWANIHSIASSDFRSSNLQGIRSELKAKESNTESQKHLDYQSLFAETEATGPVDHDSSILSPAAYFVDLMRLIKTTVKNVPSGLNFEERRPDLNDIVLDAKNTTTEVPYLEIVNDVLAKNLKADTGEDKLQQLATSIYPFNLPYNAPLERIRIYLKHFNTDLATIYRLFNAKPVAIARETLGLSIEGYELIATADPSYEGVSKAYGVPRGDTFKFRIITRHTWEPEIPATGKNLVVVSYLHEQLEILIFDANGTLVNTKGREWLNPRAHGLTELERQLGIPWEIRLLDKDRIIRKAKEIIGGFEVTVDDLRKLETLTAQSGLTQHQQKELVYQGLKPADGIDEYIYGDRQESFTFEFESVADAHNLFVNRCITRKIGETIDLKEDKVRFYLLMSTEMLDLIYITEGHMEALQGGGKMDGVGHGHGLAYEKFWESWHQMMNIVWDTLHRFVRLAKQLGWSFTELNSALMSVDAEDLGEKAIIALAKIKKLKDRFKLPIDELTCIWHNMDWHARENEDSFRLALVALNQFLTSLRDRPNAEIVWNVNARKTARDTAIQSHLCGTLGVGDADLDAIVSHLLKVDSLANVSNIKLTLKFITRLLKISKLANVLGLRVSEALLLLERLDKNEIKSVDDFIYVIDYSDWLKDAGLSVDELQYMTNGVSSPYVDAGYTKEGVRSLLAELSGAASEFRLKVTDFKRDGFDETDAELLFSLAKNAYFLDENGNIIAVLQELYGDVLGAFHFDEDELVSSSPVFGVIRDALDDDANKIAISKLGGIQYLLVTITKKTDLSSLFVGDKEQKPKIKRVRKAIMQLQRVVPLITSASFVGNDIDQNESGKIIKALDALEGDSISEYVPGFWSVSVYVFEKDFSTIFPFLNMSQRESVRRTLRNVSDRILNRVIKSRQQLRVSFIVEKLANFFSTEPNLMRALIDSSSEATAYAYKILMWNAPIKSEQDLAPGVNDFFQTLSQHVFLAKKMKLGTKDIDELDLIIGRSHRAGSIDPFFTFSLADIRTIQVYKKLSSAFPAQKGDLLTFLRDSSNTENLASCTGWDEKQIKFINDEYPDKVKAHNPVARISNLKCIFDLASRMGVDITFLSQLFKLSDESVNVKDEQTKGENWQAHTGCARNLLNVVKAKYDATQWEGVHDPMASHLNERERDALVSLLRHQLGQNKTVAKHFDEMTTLQDLSNYLLIDVEMSGVAKVSRVKQGLNSLQRYIQRCHMGLEGEGAVTLAIGDKEWAWRSHYRLWEANRKVFLYPENYLDPGLRKIKTPLFKELEDELLQGEITDESVTKAYINYFDKLDELANLKIVDACAATVIHSGATSGEETLFIIGKTKNDPPAYYYRSAVLNRNRQISQWRPWQKINLSIHVDSVSCLYANHRLHLFWVEQKHSSERAEITGEKTTTTKAAVKFSYQSVSGNWVPPQVLPGREEVVINKVKDQVSDFIFTDMSSPFPPDKPVANLILSRLAVENDPKATLSFRYIDASKAKVLANKFLPNANIVSAFHPVNGEFQARADSTIYSKKVGDSKIEDLVMCHDLRTLYACNEDGQVWYSLNNGDTWKGLMGGKFKDQKVCSLALNNDGTLLYAGTHTGEIIVHTFKNIYGISDLAVNLNNEKLEGLRIISLALSPGCVFVGTQKHGILRCSDTFSNIVCEAKNDGLTTKDIIDIKVSPDGLTLFAITNDGVFRSDNRGDLWVAKNKGLMDKKKKTVMTIMALTMSRDGRTLFAGTISGGVYRSDDKGDLWTEKNNGLLTENIRSLALSTNDRILYAGTNGGGTFVSYNKGDDWTVIENMHSSDSELYVWAIAMSMDGSTLFIGLIDGTVMRFQNRPDIVIEVASDNTQTMLGVANCQEDYRFYRLGSHAANELRGKLITRGVKELLLLASQDTAESLSFENMGLIKPCPEESLDFELSSAYAIYYREIFFHIPFLIADTLNRNQRFEDAQKWYHYIFNPMPQHSSNGNSNDNDDPTPFWRYLPFKHHNLEKLQDIEKNNPGEFKIYTDDPFDPHAIAGLRLGAYEKAIVMKYIDNLLDWGDQLFAQDSWESIVQAMMLYVMAQDLLGKKQTQTQLTHSPKLINLSDLLDKKIDLADPFHVEDTRYFLVAPNTNFAGYWDRAEDRLFKIRHCMNIKGIVRQLALFQPPIDPRQLIRAMAAGGDITSGASLLAAPVPHYRFSTMIQQAKSVTNTLIQLGSALLSALEKKDAEQLNLLRSAHEKAILSLTTRVKEKQIDDARTNLDSLTASLEGAELRQKHYTNLAAQKLIKEETSSLNLMTLALHFQEAASALHLVAVPGYLMPNIWGMADGGSNFGKAAETGAQVSEIAATVLNQGSQLATTKAQNERRQEEWQLQEKLAGHDIEQIKAQIDGGKIKQEVAQMDLDMHQKNNEQADEREDLLRGKFTNRELYQWMSGRISSVYFQTYKIAFDLAQAAEKSYQYERNTDDTLITFGYWDSLKKGLLAGERLMLGLNQLEKAYMDDNERTLEIEKTISLRQMDPQAWLDLRSGGKCAFDLSEALFDRDFPGHYCRKIASIAITIPAIVGPYQNVQATLTQQTSRVVLTDNIDTIKYLLPADTNDTTPKSAPPVDQLRSDPRVKQQIALSKGANDSGMFELNFHDERYLPFEGTGAVSSWELRMPKATNRIDFNSISDVIIHLRYTALDGGASLRQNVEKLIQQDAGFRLISLRQQFSEEWQRFRLGKDNQLSFAIKAHMFPLNLDAKNITLGDLTARVLVNREHGPGAVLSEDADGNDLQIKLEAKKGKGEVKSDMTLGEYVLSTDEVDKLDDLVDICVIVPYEGTLNWDSD